MQCQKNFDPSAFFGNLTLHLNWLQISLGSRAQLVTWYTLSSGLQLWSRVESSRIRHRKSRGNSSTKTKRSTTQAADHRSNSPHSSRYTDNRLLKSSFHHKPGTEFYADSQSITCRASANDFLSSRVAQHFAWLHQLVSFLYPFIILEYCILTELGRKWSSAAIS